LIQTDGRVVGGVHVSGMDTVLRRGSIGYWVAAEYEGQGVAGAALQAYVGHLWREYPQLVRLELRILPGNERSERLVMRCGFVEEGRLRSDFRINGKVENSLLFGMPRPC
jgi:ribosomal-protein-serine acetyltransferase